MNTTELKSMAMYDTICLAVEVKHWNKTVYVRMELDKKGDYADCAFFISEEPYGDTHFVDRITGTITGIIAHADHLACEYVRNKYDKSKCTHG